MKKYAYVSVDEKILWIEYISEKIYQITGSIFEKNPEKKEINLFNKKVKFLTPFNKNKVIGLAYNYKSLVDKEKSSQEPLVFFKSNTSLIPHLGDIIYPDFASKVWIEAELCIIIGKKAKKIKQSEASNYILGYMCGNDATALNLYKRDWHLARSKGLDTFAPLGPYLIKEIDTSDLRIQSFINKKKTQDSRTSDRILNDEQSVALISNYFTLYPGDIIFTGTPAGATDAIVKQGDEVLIEIEKIGKLINKIK